jgi:DNA-directed RNA polymerase subunit RPC12/RpoP
VGGRIFAEIESMPETAEKFACGGCGREMTWKRQFVGKRIKCKSCGHSMAVPPQPLAQEPQAEGEELYALSDLADDARSAASKLPPTIVQSAATGIAVAAATGSAQPAIPLAYQRGPTARDLERSAASVIIDKKRDIQVPIALLLTGVGLYLSYYSIHYHLGSFGIIAISIGLVLMALLKTAVLFGFALIVAGPLGVSFGGIGTALLKFAAIALFCDGVVTWTDGLFEMLAGPSGGLSFAAVGFPVTLGVYWVTLIYLFSMDPGDSWMVVVILTVFSMFLRWALILLLLAWILSFGGVAASAVAIPSAGGPSVATSPVIDEVNRAKAQNVLHEAREYVARYGRTAEKGTVDGWYAAGAKNVWFETDRDINGKGNAFQMVVELPDDPTARAKCYDVGRKYLNDNGYSFAAKALQDAGDPYLLVPLP